MSEKAAILAINVIVAEWRRLRHNEDGPQTGAFVSRIELVVVAKLTCAAKVRGRRDRAQTA